MPLSPHEISRGSPAAPASAKRVHDENSADEFVVKRPRTEPPGGLGPNSQGLRNQSPRPVRNAVAMRPPAAVSCAADLDAEDTFRFINERFYAPGFGSVNKVDPAADAQALEAAEAEVNALGALKDHGQRARAARASGAHNCFSLALLARNDLASKGSPAAMIYRNGHALAVSGPQEDLENLPEDIGQWPPTLRIVDVWAGFSCRPHQYRTLFEAAMQELEKRGIRIKADEDLGKVKPTNALWLGRVFRGPLSVHLLCPGDDFPAPRQFAEHRAPAPV